MISRAYYSASIETFLTQSNEAILGLLSQAHGFALEMSQRDAWLGQLVHLRQALPPLVGGEVHLEFAIPRMGKRADAVVLYGRMVFVIEYKVGATKYDRQSIDQVLDYALDLKNFHATSHNRPIVPILIATRAPAADNSVHWYDDHVAQPLLSNGDNLAFLIETVITEARNETGNDGFSEADPEQDDDWAGGSYKPTPTIVEAAQALYQGHGVEEIARSGADPENLTRTTEALNAIILRSREQGIKSICLVTGVPGAGKTLAGLNIATKTAKSADVNAVFLSGNGPLVMVLREALARDEVGRSARSGASVNKRAALSKVSAFIQNVHHFRDEGLRSVTPPIEHVVVFDEAQRAWDRASAEKFMTKKRGAASFDMSEPEFLISLMDRRQDWATVICLVGGGQEINTGEAGLTEWLDALHGGFRHWHVYHSAHVKSRDYSWGEDVAAKLAPLNTTEIESLHLAVSVRSYRAARLSEFVDAIIAGDAARAYNLRAALAEYPLAISRDLAVARAWLRSRARGTERLGLVASSGANRLKPEGLHVKAKIDPVYWFLNGKEDVRSSYYLEDVATEFDIQGLELDWTGVCWDADLRRSGGEWHHYDFRGTKWQNVGEGVRRTYLSNAYRVLLTRARQGMIVFVPRGNVDDPTRPPQLYDETYNFLRSCGLEDY